MKIAYVKLISKITLAKDLPLLLVRLILAYGFYKPAMMKLNDISAIAEWFADMGLPAPALNAYLATYTEVFGFVLLAVGLATRFITIPLIVTMIVAIKTVHWSNGFDAADNGFEIPLYYLVMLLLLFVNGAGKMSLDYLIAKRVYVKNK